ncbi:MAG: sugar phosphate nucleotidyltransferase [Spirochaetes bacterium]|nr:sugar phosphate nucleotidyltransferase [Spirochaetota bacterium]
MRFALILAGGSGTRLWPMSRSDVPKQLIPLLNGRSLLSLSYGRLEGLVEAARRFVCAGEAHRTVILQGLPGLDPENFLGEPTGRDTLNALAYSAAVIERLDPDATMGVFTADALIDPDDRFRQIVSSGYEIAERSGNALVTFGISPTHHATSFGYLKLGEHHSGEARIVTQFREKPEKQVAEQWVSQGPGHYLWNSGMFVWKAATFLDCVRRYEPETHAAILRIVEDRGRAEFPATIGAVYPKLKKISVDYGVMERAACDPALQVVAVPMDISWTDVGTWPAIADFFPRDQAGNSCATERSILVDSSGTFVASSDPAHVVAVFGGHDLIVVHTPDATLVCRRDNAEGVKKLQTLVAERFGARYG